METTDTILALIEQEEMLDAVTVETVLQEHRDTGRSVLAILKRDHLLSEEQMVWLVAATNKIDFITLSPESVEPMVAHLVSYEMANRYTLIPIQTEGNCLTVAMASPMNLVVRDQIEMKTGYQVIPVAATPNAIRQAVHFHFDVTNVTKQAIASMRLKEDKHRDEEREDEDDYGLRGMSERVANDPITKLVASVLRGGIDARASDVHIEPQSSDVRVRYRVDGILRSAITLPVSAHKEVVSHIKIVSGMDISEKRVPQDGHMSIRHYGKDYDLRVSSLPAMDGEKIVIRILDKTTNQWDLDSVINNAGDNRKFRDMVANPYGMLLVTGPTGSGKTTTLYSLLQLLNTSERNIVTVEDPVEYRLDGITQVQVRPQAGMTFASALRSILRQDPDAILIGEIRDLETAEIAISSALTGHLVLSTLHTNDAVGAISRLINIGIPPFLVGSALLGTVAQRLIRTVCPKCRQADVPTKKELRQLCPNQIPNDTPTVYRATGCPDCSASGYKGRKSIYEILSVSRGVRAMIMGGQNDDAIVTKAMEEGMVRLRDSAMADVMAGITTLDEISRTVEMSET
ncbi:GspE/PulE family protein [Planctomycetota bacterium]